MKRNNRGHGEWAPLKVLAMLTVSMHVAGAYAQQSGDPPANSAPVHAVMAASQASQSDRLEVAQGTATDCPAPGAADCPRRDADLSMTDAPASGYGDDATTGGDSGSSGAIGITGGGGGGGTGTVSPGTAATTGGNPGHGGNGGAGSGTAGPVASGNGTGGSGNQGA